MGESLKKVMLDSCSWYSYEMAVCLKSGFVLVCPCCKVVDDMVIKRGLCLKSVCCSSVSML